MTNALCPETQRRRFSLTSVGPDALIHRFALPSYSSLAALGSAGQPVPVAPVSTTSVIPLRSIASSNGTAMAVTCRHGYPY